MNVLFVEDDDISRTSLSALLKKAGFEVTEAVDGAQCLAILEAGAFDVILMDVQMPVMDGVQATRSIRQNPRLKDQARIPIIALTGYSMRSDKERFLAAGMTEVLTKPVELREVLASIGKVLETPRPA